MTPDQFVEFQEKMMAQIDASVNTSINAKVNGKIDRLTFQLETYIDSDNKWKEAAAPSIELGANVRGFGKVLAYLIATFAGLYGIFAAVKHIVK